MSRALREQVGEKLDPRNFTGMSSQMAALVAHVVEEVPFTTDPAIAELAVTSDDLVMARTTGHVGANVLIGSLSDFVRNWDNLIDAAGLTLDEEIALRGWLEARVKRPGPMPVEALQERRQAAAARRQEAYRALAQAGRQARIDAGECFLEGNQCVTHGVPDSLSHYFATHPDAYND